MHAYKSSHFWWFWIILRKMKDLESSQDAVHINYFMNTFIEYFSIFFLELLHVVWLPTYVNRVFERVSKYKKCILEYISCHPRSNHNQINFIGVLTLFIFHMLKYIFLVSTVIKKTCIEYKSNPTFPAYHEPHTSITKK